MTIYWSRGGNVTHYYRDCPTLKGDLKRGRRLASREWDDLPPLRLCGMCLRLEINGHQSKADPAPGEDGGDAVHP